METTQPRYHLVNDALVAEWKQGGKERWIVLDDHPEFSGYWLVDGFTNDYFFDLKDLIGPYRAVAPADLECLFDLCDKCDYQVAFFDDPTEKLREYERLNQPPDFALNSTLPGTIQGFLPFQIQGFNFLRDLEGGVALWSTGVGKTVLASALIRHHWDHQAFDLAWFVVKSHNKINTQRAVERLVGLQSLVVGGDKKARKALYRAAADIDEPRILITNYEKFRVDHEEILPLFEGTRVLCIWDEMPTKLANRTSQLYKAVCRCLYRTNAPAVNWAKKRPAELRQYMLSATPIETDPEDWFNCVRLLDPRVYGTVSEFEDTYVKSYSYFDPSKPDTWHELDRMGLMAAHMTHQVDKEDPDIAAMFPEIIEEDRYLDWDDEDRKIYNRLANEAIEIGMEDVNTLALISVLQMLCDAPSIVARSAANFNEYIDELEEYIESGGDDLAEIKRRGSETALRLVEKLDPDLTDERHTKLKELQQILLEEHPQEKAVLFTKMNNTLMPVLEDRLRRWDVSYVRYEGSPGERQAAEDTFRTDPSIRVFLSSDAGSDSINLEVASLVVHYDLPWNWSRKIQRQNRIHRVTSDKQKVKFISLLMADSVEDRIREIIERKYAFHKGVFKGAIASQAVSARLTREDLLYILRGC